MTAIVTLTMNPALDKSTRTPYVVPEDKLRCEALTVEPGGGGINVSRAIQKLGGESLLLHLSGGLNGQALQNLLRKDHLNERRLPIESETRESFTVLEASSTRQYRFTMPGPTLRQHEWEQVLEAVVALNPAPDYLVASGSLPPSVPDDFYVRVAAVLADRPTRVVVDTSGRALHTLANSGGPIFLIKPNLRELSELMGRDLRRDSEIVEAARGLLNRGRIEVIVVSLGAAGVLLVSKETTAQLRSPTVPIVSKIGAGDSTVAGITLGLARGLALLDAVRYGVAAGAAAVMTPGSELCRREDTEQLFLQLQSEPAIPR
jgi:6-phosphofructokinase 2